MNVVFAHYPTEKFSTEPRARTPKKRPRSDGRRRSGKFKFKTRQLSNYQIIYVSNTLNYSFSSLLKDFCSKNSMYFYFIYIDIKKITVPHGEALVWL